MNTRTNWLLVFTALVVAYVRNYIQYQRYFFETLWEFLGFWFVHYLAIGLVGAVFYALFEPVRKVVLRTKRSDKLLSMDDIVIAWCLALMLCAIVVFVLAHWPAGYAESLDF